MEEMIANPPREVVEYECSKCPLFPSKAGNEKVGQHVLAAVESASRLKRAIETKTAPLIFKNANDLSAKRCAMYYAYVNAENRSERKRLDSMGDKDGNSGSKSTITFDKDDGF